MVDLLCAHVTLVTKETDIVAQVLMKHMMSYLYLLSGFRVSVSWLIYLSIRPPIVRDLKVAQTCFDHFKRLVY